MRLGMGDGMGGWIPGLFSALLHLLLRWLWLEKVQDEGQAFAMGLHSKNLHLMIYLLPQVREVALCGLKALGDAGLLASRFPACEEFGLGNHRLFPELGYDGL